MRMLIIHLLNYLSVGAKPLEGAKKLVLVKEAIKSCTTTVRSAGQSSVPERFSCSQ